MCYTFINPLKILKITTADDGEYYLSLKKTKTNAIKLVFYFKYTIFNTINLQT